MLDAAQAEAPSKSDAIPPVPPPDPPGLVRFGSAAHDIALPDRAATLGLKPDTVWSMMEEVGDIAWLPDGQTFLTSGWTGPPVQRRLGDPQQAHFTRFEGNGTTPRGIGVFPDGRLIAMNLFDPVAPAEVLNPESPNPPWSLGESPHQTVCLAPGRSDRVVVQTSEAISTLHTESGEPVAEHRGSHLLFADAEGNVYSVDRMTVRVTDIETGAFQRTYTDREVRPRDRVAVTAAARSADGRRLAVAYGRRYNWLAISPDHPDVAGADCGIRLLDVETGRVVRRLEGHRAYAHSLQFSPDGRWLISRGHDGTVRIWSVGRGKEVIRLGGCLLYTSPSPRDRTRSRMPSSA